MFLSLVVGTTSIGEWGGVGGKGEADRDLERSPRECGRNFLRELPKLTMCSSASSFSLCTMKERGYQRQLNT